MAAVAYPMANPWVTTGPDRPDGRVYRRRRAVALVMLAAVLLLAAAALRLALAGSGSGALTTTGSSGAPTAQAPVPVMAHAYVVQPGDTLWSIVRASGHHGDPRPEVDRLALELNGRPLQVGQRLQLP